MQGAKVQHGPNNSLYSYFVSYVVDRCHLLKSPITPGDRHLSGYVTNAKCAVSVTGGFAA